MAGVVTGVTESETSEPETSDTGEKGKLEPGLRILRDLINKSEIGSDLCQPIRSEYSPGAEWRIVIGFRRQ